MGTIDTHTHSLTNTLTLVMTENLLIPQRMLYQIPGDSMYKKRDKEGKGCVSIRVCVRACESDRQTWRQRDKKNGRAEQSKGKEKWLKSYRIAKFTFTQRLTERTCSCVSYVPMSLHLTASGLRISVTNFAASRRISMTLFSSANAGASGKEATNRDTNPYWITVNIKTRMQAGTHC